MRRLPNRGIAPPALATSEKASKAILSYKAAKGLSKFNFSASIYGAVEVRERLKNLQAGTCAYCEVTVEPVTRGDIEHFRPKGGYRNLGESVDTQPGYYWLAYNWNNLMIACPRCNQDCKKTFFPLMDGGVRCLNSAGDLSGEKAGLIDPFQEDPRDHIRFHEEVPYAYHDSERGALTISLLALDCEELNVARAKWLETVRLIRSIATGDDGPQKDNAREWLLQYSGGDGQFSSCVRDM